MRANVEKLENSEVLLRIEVEPEEVEKALDRAFKKVVKKYTIPGFRKGKAPRVIFENFMGKAPLYDEALEELLPQNYLKAVEETKIEPVAQPELDIEQLEEDKPLVFTAKVAVKPEVILGEYIGIEATKKEAEVKDEHVESQLKMMQQRYAQLVEVEEAEKGDIVNVNFEGFDQNGEVLEDLKRESVAIEAGSSFYIPGLADALIGVKAGEEKELEVSFPEDYANESLRGKKVNFHVQVLDIKRKKIAPLDDEFAKDVSEFDTLEELKADIRQNLKKQLEDDLEKLLKNQIVDKVVEGSKLEIPQVMVEDRLNAMIENWAQNLMMQGVNPSQYLQAMGLTVDQMRENLREEALKGLKAELVLEAIATKENIEVSEEDVEQRLKEIAEAYHQDLNEVKEMLNNRPQEIELLKRDIMFEKTINFLRKNATIITEEEKKEDNQEQANEEVLIDEEGSGNKEDLPSEDEEE